MNCEYTTEETTDGRFLHTCSRCGRAIVTNRRNHHRECTAEDPENPDRWSPLPCIHRGAELRQVACNTCGQRDALVPVYACAVMAAGECTEKRTDLWPRLPHCFGCHTKVVTYDIQQARREAD